jgi:hypothetical protein
MVESIESCHFLQIDRVEPAVTGCGISPDCEGGFSSEHIGDRNGAKRVKG